MIIADFFWTETRLGGGGSRGGSFFVGRDRVALVIVLFVNHDGLRMNGLRVRCPWPGITGAVERPVSLSSQRNGEENNRHRESLMLDRMHVGDMRGWKGERGE